MLKLRHTNGHSDLHPVGLGAFSSPGLLPVVESVSDIR
jgi:hypothetical protein